MILTPYPEQGMGDPNVSEKFSAPSLAHPFGTDDLGRDLLARVMFGARTSLIASFAIVGVSMIIGTLLGAIAGYFGGWIDEVIMRITDIFLAFPPLLLAITIASVLEPSLRNSVLAVAITWWPWYTRIVRAQAVSIRERNFVRAAHSMGVGDWAIAAHLAQRAHARLGTGYAGSWLGTAHDGWLELSGAWRAAADG